MNNHLSAKPEQKIPNVSGAWKGKTGALHLLVSGRTVSGTYDWGASKSVGMLEGKIENNVIKFEWSWSKAIRGASAVGVSGLAPSGVGFFIIDEGGKLLRGGWFPYRKEFDLEKARKGVYDSILNTWVFYREEKPIG